MPKIFGTSLLGILAATIVFYILGILWYGPIFGETWLALSGMTKEAAGARMEAMGPMFYVWGLLITIAQVIGLSYVLQQAGASVLGTCAKIGVILAVLFVLPFTGYASLYGDIPVKLMMVDFGHLLVGWTLSCIIMSFFRGKDAAGE